jgi:hypothetical protein
MKAARAIHPCPAVMFSENEPVVTKGYITTWPPYETCLMTATTILSLCSQEQPFLVFLQYFMMALTILE